MNERDASREAVGAELRTRIAAFDDATLPPPGLFERVTAPADRHHVRNAVAGRGRWSTMVLAAVAVTCVVLGLVAGIGWQRRQLKPQDAAGTHGVEMTVYNAEAACQPLRTIECGLSVRPNPYRLTQEAPVARLWHGDHFVADCVVVDGKRMNDEAGVTSSRWYKIRTADGAVGFLPAVRTHNTVEVAVCAPSEVPR
jgi:hypothetical protein